MIFTSPIRVVQMPLIVAAFGRMWRDRSGSRGGRARGSFTSGRVPRLSS